jgi:hypothetical protein
MIGNFTTGLPIFLVVIMLVVSPQLMAGDSGETLIESLKAADETARQALEEARRDHEYFSGLLSLARKAAASPGKHGTDLLKNTLEGIRSSRLDKGLMPHLYDFFRSRDKGFTAWLEQQTLSVVATSSPPSADQAAQFRSDFIIGARNLGFRIEDSPERAAWKIEQEISIIDQGKVLNTSLLSRRAGGHFTLSLQGKKERIARHMSEAGAHLDPASAAARAVKKLSDSALETLVEVALEEYAAR